MAQNEMNQKREEWKVEFARDRAAQWKKKAKKKKQEEEEEEGDNMRQQQPQQ